MISIQAKERLILAVLGVIVPTADYLADTLTDWLFILGKAICAL
jgi:hypothetical protein